MMAVTIQSAEERLDASFASLSATIDKANLRLDLTRAALKALIGNDFAYLHMLAAIEGAVDEGISPDEMARLLGALAGDEDAL